MNRQVDSVELVSELDADGEAMMCEGCGTTRTIAAILAQHGPKAIACCPERKMVQARHFWHGSQGGGAREIERLSSRITDMEVLIDEARATVAAFKEAARLPATAAMSSKRVTVPAIIYHRMSALDAKLQHEGTIDDGR